MQRFRVIVTGTGMSIPPWGSSGFATTRFVRAPSPEDAAQKALALVAASVAAEPAFASSPVPALAIDTVARVLSPFKLSRPNEGYTFVGKDAELEDALHIERQVGTGWFF
jgi:hypothetical protein